MRCQLVSYSSYYVCNYIYAVSAITISNLFIAFCLLKLWKNKRHIPDEILLAIIC